jgi:nucleoside-diphosphate-sugar epimerase
MKKLLIFGFGYVAQFLSQHLKSQDWTITGTTRDPFKAKSLNRYGYQTLPFSLDIPDDYTHILYSIPPSDEIDLNFLNKFKNAKWIGYLSATSVYGDHQGNWVDEETLATPLSPQGKSRREEELKIENLLHPSVIFRLSGIYGPRRNTLESLKAGKATRVDKPGHSISRIHVDDIVQALQASMNNPDIHGIFNLSDSAPCDSREVIEYAAQLLNIPPPPLIPYGPDVPETLRRFYEENRKIRNEKVLNTFDLKLKYPTYKEGLAALLS